MPVLLLSQTWQASAQVPGQAEIESPSQGQVLTGLVLITGTAFHSDFAGYDLAFAYDQDPTDTWFPLTDLTVNTVKRGRLALWDTTHISDGAYSLRLRVLTNDGSVLTAEVTGLKVSSDTLAEGLAAPSTVQPLPAQLTTVPLEEPTAVPSIPEPLRRRVESPSHAFAVGLIVGAGALGTIGLYTLARSWLRRAIGSVRMRGIYGSVRRRRRDQAP